MGGLQLCLMSNVVPAAQPRDILFLCKGILMSVNIGPETQGPFQVRMYVAHVGQLDHLSLSSHCIMLVKQTVV